jgi:hypothetical protein
MLTAEPTGALGQIARLALDRGAQLAPDIVGSGHGSGFWITANCFEKGLAHRPTIERQV